MPFVQDDLSAVVEQDILVDGAVVLDGEVVAVGELHVVEDLHAFADVLEDVAAEHAAEAESEPVVEAEWRAVEHLPEPDERLAEGVPLDVDVTVVLGLERGVARVEGLKQNIGGELAGERGLFASALLFAQGRAG